MLQKLCQLKSQAMDYILHYAVLKSTSICQAVAMQRVSLHCNSSNLLISHPKSTWSGTLYWQPPRGSRGSHRALNKFDCDIVAIDRVICQIDDSAATLAQEAQSAVTRVVSQRIGCSYV